MLRIRLLAIAAGVLLLDGAVLAHHAYTAEFDTTKPVKLTGVITRLEWSNPHIWIYLDVKDDKGNVTNWGFSGGAPGQLMRRGITKKVIEPGATITVEGFRSKDGSNNANGARVTFPDGRQVFTAGSEDRTPGEAK